LSEVCHERQKKPSKKKNPPAKEKPAKQVKAAVNEKKPADRPKQTNDFPVVGLGASAGGLEALEIFFSHMPTESGMGFVIIQHLSPTHKSIMGSLLAKDTQMKILEIKDGMPRSAIATTERDITECK
jgi:two-component system CheB/CheR fusion protein